MGAVAVNDLQFLAGGGEMGELTRAKDWGKTPVGDPENWPQSLRTTLSILLNSGSPMVLFWGSDLICFYNDAFRPSLGKEGKHPDILGMKGKNAWAEIWDTIKPWIDTVLNENRSVWKEDLLVPIYRNGKIEDVYWTFSYSPVHDESGKAAGVFVAVVETTAKVNTLKKIEESENLFRSVVEQSISPILIMKGEDLKVEIANEPLFKVWGVTKDVIGKNLLDVLPEMTDQPFLALLKDVLHTGVPYYGYGQPAYFKYAGGEMQTVYFDFVYQPLRESDGSIKGVLVSAIDVTEKTLAHNELTESEQKFHLLADAMPQHIWTSDTEGNLNYYNQSVFDYSGLTLEQINKDGWIQIVHPDDREENIKQWSNAIATGKDFLLEHRFRRHDGTYRWQLSRAIPQKDENGEIQMWVGTSTDIQDIKEMDQQKDNFLSMASHELKTPVTTIKAYGQIAEAMLAKKGDTQTLAIVSKMSTQVNRLTNLIGDLLDITKIQKGKLRYNEAFFDFNETVKEVVDDMQKISATHHIQNNAVEDVKIYGDKEKISQVLNNLISNAIKYSPMAHSIIVSTQLKENGIELGVKDFGIGIPAKEQPNVFEQFYRVNGNNQSTFPGMGIGLFICSEITKMHGGKIWADSTMGEGSTFYIWLPYDHRKMTDKPG
ncbi:MAG: ATP-binding protein [Ginsengibacter sp.]